MHAEDKENHKNFLEIYPPLEDLNLNEVLSIFHRDLINHKLCLRRALLSTGQCRNVKRIWLIFYCFIILFHLFHSSMQFWRKKYIKDLQIQVNYGTLKL